MATQRRALGRGLSALLGSPETELGTLREIDIDRIVPNTHQPRKNFNNASLDELAASIRIHGVLQPIVVRAMPDGSFQLIAGERRWRASQRAGLTRLPAVVRDSGDHDALEIALIENLQREDLNPIEEARAYERLMNEFNLTQEEVSRRVGKSRVTITNMLRLLKLPPEVQNWLQENRLTTGHAKALLSLHDLNAILDSARRIIEGEYSVRQAEALVARYNNRKSTDVAPNAAAAAIDPNVAAAIRSLEQVLGTKVTITESSGKGQIAIHFFSTAEMNRIYDGLLRVRF